MPQLQVLEGVPGFGERLGQALGGGIGEGISQRLQQYHQQKQNQTALQGLRPFLKEAGIESDQDFNQIIQSGLPAQMVANLALESAHRKRQEAFQREKLEQQYKMHQEKLSSKQKNEGENIQGIFDTMSKMVASDVPGIGISPLTSIGASREGVQNRAMFKSMRSGIEAALVPRVNRGALARDRFQFILSLIPDPSESQRAIAGKLAGLSEALSEEGIPLDTSVLKTIPWFKETLEKIEPQKKMSEQKEELKVGQTFEKLPSASQIPNGIIRKGNKRYQSDGKTWKEIK